MAAGAAVIAVGVIANVVFRYFRYDAYKQYLSSYEVESGSEFQAAKDDKTVRFPAWSWLRKTIH